MPSAAAPAPAASSDPFAQWTNPTNTSSNPNQDLFDPLAAGKEPSVGYMTIKLGILAPAPKADSGPDLMGNWNAGNILQNTNRPNFSHMQQQKVQPTKHDPFANLTDLGSSLPKQAQPSRPPMQHNNQQQQQQQPRATSPYAQNNGVSAGGAWGAQFQTRQAPMQGGGGWNPNGMLLTTLTVIHIPTHTYKKTKQK